MINGNTIVYLDEVTFNLDSSPRGLWVKNEEKLKVGRKDGGNYIQGIVAYVAKMGVIGLTFVRGYINFQDFSYYLIELLKEIKNLDIDRPVIFMDNHSAHHKAVDYLENELSVPVPCIFNIPHNPQLNLIENFFSRVKRNFEIYHNSDSLCNLQNSLSKAFTIPIDKRYGFFRNHLRRLSCEINLQLN